MKYLIAVLLMTVVASATTFTAASCSAADFNTQIALATDGDTVQGPLAGGSATWSSVPSVTKGITLDGKGCNITITRTSGGLNITSGTVANTVVTNFNFINGFINGGCPINLTSAAGSNTIRMYNNTFFDGGGGGADVTFVCTQDIGPVLIDHNTVHPTNGADETFHILGGSWTATVTPGSNSMVVMENNFWNCPTGSAGCKPEEAFNGSFFVFRYNKIFNGAMDVHDGTLGGRWFEAYNNSFTFSGSNTAMSFRGGSGLVYSNTVVSGGPAFLNIGPFPSSSDTCGGTWPVQFQTGRGYNGTQYSPMYAWGNSSTDFPVNNDCPSQVTIGTAPTDAANCSSHAGNVCDAVVTTSAPTSFTYCQQSSGCPQSLTSATYLASIVYPHPLDNCPTNVFGTATCVTSAPSTPSLRMLLQ